MVSTLLRSTSYLFAFLIASVADIANADNGKVLDPEIKAAQEAFKESIHSAKELLQERLDKKLEFAQRRGELELTETVMREIREFKSKGILPTSVPVDGYVTTFERALNQLESAYDQVVRNYVREGKLDDARYLQGEFAKFKSLPSNHPVYADAEFEIKSGASSFQTLKKGAKVFVDRTYTWQKTSDDFPFKQFAPIRGEGREPIVIDVKSPGLVYIALNDEHRDRVVAFLREFDWKPTEHHLTGSAKNNRPAYVFQRVFETGEHVIPRVNFSGPMIFQK